MTLCVAPTRNEPARAERLRSLAILDTLPEPIFDALARAAADVCGTPIAIVGLLDADRFWCKAWAGLPARPADVARSVAFEVQAITSRALVEICDAQRDAQCAAHPLVAGGPRIRFHAAAPIVLSDGSVPGALCVMDPMPRRLTAAQRETLAALAAGAAEALEARERALQAAAAARRAQQCIEQAYTRTPAMLQSIDAAGRLLMVSDVWLAALGYRRDEVLGRRCIDFLAPASRRAAAAGVLPALLRDGRCDRVSCRMLRKDGSVLEGLVSAVLERDADGRPWRSMAIVEEAAGRLD